MSDWAANAFGGGADNEDDKSSTSEKNQAPGFANAWGQALEVEEEEDGFEEFEEAKQTETDVPEWAANAWGITCEETKEEILEEEPAP
jgi:hypothetical protein